MIPTHTHTHTILQESLKEEKEREVSENKSRDRERENKEIIKVCAYNGKRESESERVGGEEEEGGWVSREGSIRHENEGGTRDRRGKD